MPKPLHNRVLVKPDPVATETTYGFILPDTDDKPVSGTVLVGNTSVSAGDRVLFSKYGFDEVEVNKESLYVVSDSCLLAIL